MELPPITYDGHKEPPNVRTNHKINVTITNRAKEWWLLLKSVDVAKNLMWIIAVYLLLRFLSFAAHRKSGHLLGAQLCH